MKHCFNIHPVADIFNPEFTLRCFDINQAFKIQFADVAVVGSALRSTSRF